MRELLHKKVREAYLHPQFITDVLKPLNLEALFDQEVQVRERYPGRRRLREIGRDKKQGRGEAGGWGAPPSPSPPPLLSLSFSLLFDSLVDPSPVDNAFPDTR